MPNTTLSGDTLRQLRERAQRSLSAEPRPFVKWAGSKRGLLSHLVPHLPVSYRVYHEPFLGSGALFFLLEPQRARLNDRCLDLIETYIAVKSNAAAVADAALSVPFDKESYYKVRGERSQDPITRAGEFLFLNRACWNGLYRVNSAGNFNVPWGAPKTTFVVDKGNLVACGELLQRPNVRISHVDFEAALKGCRKDDLVFMDPPYVTRHNSNGFVDYNERIFSWNDQLRLARLAEQLRLRGCHVLVTNAFHSDVLALYPNFHKHRIDRSSTLAGASSKRGKVSEVLLVGKEMVHG